MRSISHVVTSDRVIQQLQSNLVPAVNSLLALALLQGNYITQTLAVGSNTINHLLSRSYQGWIVVDTNAAGADLYSTTSSTPDKTLLITSAAIATVKFYIF